MADLKRTLPYITPLGEFKQVVGTVIEPIESREPWGEYRLEDGTIIRCKQILTQLVRLDGEKLSTGEQVYNCQFQAIINVFPPE